jgi:hypothetical protein
LRAGRPEERQLAELGGRQRAEDVRGFLDRHAITPLPAVTTGQLRRTALLVEKFPAVEKILE